MARWRLFRELLALALLLGAFSCDDEPEEEVGGGFVAAYPASIAAIDFDGDGVDELVSPGVRYHERDRPHPCRPLKR